MATVSVMAQPPRDGYHGYQQRYNMYQTRAPYPQVDVAHSIHVNPYAAHYPQAPQHPAQQPTYGHHTAPRSPQPSGSPTSDDGFKPSLPSISNLLGIADRPGQDNGKLTIEETIQASVTLIRPTQPPVKLRYCRNKRTIRPNRCNNRHRRR